MRSLLLPWARAAPDGFFLEAEACLEGGFLEAFAAGAFLMAFAAEEEFLVARAMVKVEWKWNCLLDKVLLQIVGQNNYEH